LLRQSSIDPDALTPGKHTLVFDFTYDGPRIAKGGAGLLKVNDKVIEETIARAHD
jgi:hypothetical protein